MAASTGVVCRFVPAAWGGTAAAIAWGFQRKGIVGLVPCGASRTLWPAGGGGGGGPLGHIQAVAHYRPPANFDRSLTHRTTPGEL